MMHTLAQLRTDLAADLAAQLPQANVYPYTHASPSAPAVVIVPDDPYLEPATIGGDPIRARVRFRLVLLVAFGDSVAAQDRLDDLLVQVFAALPSDCHVERCTSHGLTQVGPVEHLAADVQVALMARLDVPAPEPIPNGD